MGSRFSPTTSVTVVVLDSSWWSPLPPSALGSCGVTVVVVAGGVDMVFVAAIVSGAVVVAVPSSVIASSKAQRVYMLLSSLVSRVPLSLLSFAFLNS